MKIEIVKIDGKFYIRKHTKGLWRKKIKYCIDFSYNSKLVVDEKGIYRNQKTTIIEGALIWGRFNANFHFKTQEEAEKVIDKHFAYIGRPEQRLEVVALYNKGKQQIESSNKDKVFELMRLMLDLEQEGRNDEANIVHNELMKLNEKIDKEESKR